MTASPHPKVILFDIGGVCVRSPFQAILDYENSLSIPEGWINYSISRSGRNGAWQRLERGEIPLDASFFAAFTADLHRPENWQAFLEREAPGRSSSPPGSPTPPLPELDAERLFNGMMSAARELDPWMFPALEKIRRSERYIVGALSNTVIFPEGHPVSRADGQTDLLRSRFDVFISSAHVGVRKPDERMYVLAVETLDAFARRNAETERGRTHGWGAGVRSEDILFLDDIGENLKAAKRQGFATIKVHLGRTHEAVEELEGITGLTLKGPRPAIAVEAKPRRNAKI